MFHFKNYFGQTKLICGASGSEFKSTLNNFRNKVSTQIWNYFCGIEIFP